MTITAIQATPPTAYEVLSTRETSGEDQGKDRFAGMLAHAHAHAKHLHKPVKPKDAASELDATNATDDDKQTTGASDQATNGDGAAATVATDVTPAPTSASTLATTAAAAAATTAPAATSINGIDRSVGALNPELQAKLARVMDRLNAETGHTATVEETYRTQARQNALFAQGRDTAGPVVTWTQNSKHTQGRAVDLVLDGGKAGSDAYAALQRIATEEGLHTLGARDPGHLELSGAGATGATNATPAQSAAPADASGQGKVSVARVAQLAQVAQVAEVVVARPATVARLAAIGTNAKAEALGKPVAEPVAGAQFAQTKDSSDDSTSSGGSDQGSQNGQRGAYGSLGSAFTMREASASTAATTVTGSTAAERVDRLMSAADNAPARPLSQITMNVDAGNGATDRIHVALRGSSLNTTIDVSDARAAQTMTSRSDELVRALNRDGMEVESMRVRAAAGNAAAIAAPAAQTADSSNTSRFQRGNPWQQQERQDSQSDRRQQREQRKGDTP